MAGLGEQLAEALDWLAEDDHPIDRPMRIIVAASLIYLFFAYFEFVKVVVPLGDHIPFSFAYLQANVPCEVRQLRVVPGEGLRAVEVDTICQRGVHYGYAWLWLWPVLVGALAIAYRVKQWGVFYWPLLATVGLMLFAHVGWLFLAFDDEFWLEDARAQHPTAVDAFFGWEGIVTAMIELFFAVVCAYAVFRMWQARRESRRARLVADVAGAMKSKEAEGET